MNIVVAFNVLQTVELFAGDTSAILHNYLYKLIYSKATMTTMTATVIVFACALRTGECSSHEIEYARKMNAFARKRELCVDLW